MAIYKEYIYKCPEPTRFWNAFYLKTDLQLRQNTKMTWYLRTPVGKGDLGQYTEKMMPMAGIDGYFTNHSLRHATATRLFNKDVDEQLIQEQTGHNSVAICHYKRPNLHLKEHVSDLLNVLPKGVEKQAPTPVNSTASKGQLDSQNTSQKGKE